MAVHISEMSWGRVENPKKVFKSGDRVTVELGYPGREDRIKLKVPGGKSMGQAAERWSRECCNRPRSTYD